MRAVIRIAAWCSLLAAAAPHAQPNLPPSTWRAADAPSELREPIARGDLIVVSLHDALQRELRSALAQGGAPFAIQSCHVDVIGVTRRMARMKGVSAGRTSDRLRNPANAAPAWAAPLVKAHAGRLARDVDGFAVDLGDAVGLLRPIVHRPMCTPCHGPFDKIDPAVRAALPGRYPSDRAVGFRDGEIRGWFWVQVPKHLR